MGLIWVQLDGQYNYEASACSTLSAGVLVTPISCNGFADGIAVVQLSGGIGPYTHTWSTGSIADTTTQFDVGCIIFGLWIRWAVM